MRPADWSPLNLAHDPTPGDPDVVRDGGHSYRDVADAISRAAATLRALDAGSSNADSVKALLENRDQILGRITVAETRYRTAGNALATYSYTLDRVQADTASALSAARSAQSDVASAERLEKHYRDLAEETTDPEPAEQAAEYRRKERHWRDEASDSRGHITNQQRVVQEAVNDRDSAAQTAIDQIEQITANDGLNDSWWDDWGAKVTAIIANIAEAVATIAGLLALVVCWIPVIGQALAGVLLVIAGIAGIVAALANIALAATGERSWGEAVVSIVFAALGCIGLGAAIRGLAGGLKAAAAGWRAAGGLAGLGGVRGLAVASGRNLAMSMRNLAKLARLKLMPSTAPRIGERKISQAVYDQLRPKSPTADIRDMVNARHAADKVVPDFALPGKTITGRLQADHIVPMDTITRMDGFGDLTRAQQLEILNFPDNFIGLSASANGSKGALAYGEWTVHKSSGLMVNPLFNTQMTHLSHALEGRIQAMIDVLS